MYYIINFLPSPGSKPDSNGCYGYVSIKAKAPNEVEANKLASSIATIDISDVVSVVKESEYSPCVNPYKPEVLNLELRRVLRHNILSDQLVLNSKILELVKGNLETLSNVYLSESERLIN